MIRLSSNLAFDRMVACDDLVAKALGVTEVSKIARSETRMREYLLSKWEELAAKAAKRAAALGASGASAAKIAEAVDNVMGEWAREVEQRYLDEVTRIYFLARIAGWKKVNGLIKEDLTYDIPEKPTPVEKADRKLVRIKPYFDVIDEQAVSVLRGHQTLWIGTHYDEKVASGIARTAKEWVVEAGKHPRQAAKALKDRLDEALGKVEVPKGYSGSAKSYFEGVVANAATVARVQGQMRSFIDYGVTTYEIVNPRDSRTCEECLYMDGKTFSVRQGSEVMNDVMAATTPDQVKHAQPWMNIGQIKAVSDGPGKAGPGDAMKLAEARFCLPPFHFKCRCTVDVSEEAGSWRLAGPGEEPPIPKPPTPPTPPEPPKAPKAPRPRAPRKPRIKPPPEVPKLAPEPIPLSEKRPARTPKGTVATQTGRPQSFPPMNQTPGTPNEEFELKRYAQYLNRSADETRPNKPYKFGLEVRRDVASICAENKMHYRDMKEYTGSARSPYSAKNKVYQILSITKGKRDYAGGCHYTYSGFLHVGTEAWKNLRSWAAKFLASPNTNELSLGIHRRARWAFEVLLHETVHGHGPALTMRAYNIMASETRRVSMLLEEVLTDSATRWMTIKKLGGTLADYNNAKFVTSVYNDGLHTFADKINEVMVKHVGKNVFDKISIAASKTPEMGGARKSGAFKMLFDSAIRFKGIDATQVETVEDFYALWADSIEVPAEALAGMTKAQADKVVKAIRKDLAEAFKSSEFKNVAKRVINYVN